MEDEKFYVYKEVKKKIILSLKNLKVNDRIPSRVKLAKEYQVTRTTVERAISELVGEGYLYTKDGSGTYVSGKINNKHSNKMEGITWGVVLPNIMQDTYPGILRGIEDVASNQRIQTIVCNTDNNPEKQNQYLTDMVNNGVGGIIIVPSIIENGDLQIFEDIIERKIPLVACNRAITGVRSPKVLSNNYYGGYMATKHLINQGFKKIAFIANIYYSISVERYKGYLAALVESGLEIDENYIYFEEPFSATKNINHANIIGHKTASLMLGLEEKPDAFFCFDDLIAQGVYHAVHEKGYGVGDEIGLVGYNNNNYICDSMPKKLSSIDFKAYEVGNEAANLLMKMNIDQNYSQHMPVIVQPELVVRETSKTIISH